MDWEGSVEACIKSLSYLYFMIVRRLKPSVPASPSPVWGKAGMGADAPTTEAVGSGISFPRLGEGRDGGRCSDD